MNVPRALLILTCATLLVSCGKKEPVKIGFIGTLSGRAAEVSQAARDGYILAIEEANAAGGINGRKINMVIFDDQHNEGKVREGVNLLADSGVSAVIGPITSQMSVAAVPAADQRQLVLFSPTSSTIKLSGKKDHFFRVIPACDLNAKRLATYAVETLAAKRVAILTDESNIAFTGPWRDAFGERFTELGGKIVARARFDSLHKNFNFSDLAGQLTKSNPDTIMVLANSIDSALFSQQIAKLGKTILILGSDWAFSGALVEYGGRSVEGFTFTTSLDLNSDAPEFVRFKKNYENRFRTTPKFPAALAYETTQILIKKLASVSDPAKLPEALSALGEVKALQGKLEFDRYGDVKRTTYINEVKDGRFVVVRKID